MILGQIFQSKQSWQKLSSMKMRPQVAYKILRYTRRVDEEFALIEKQREAALRRAAGVEEGNVSLEPDTPEFIEFAKEFNEVLMTESDMPKFGRKLSYVLESVAEGQDDVLTISDLAMLEPFFKDEEEDE